MYGLNEEFHTSSKAILKTKSALFSTINRTSIRKHALSMAGRVWLAKDKITIKCDTGINEGRKEGNTQLSCSS